MKKNRFIKLASGLLVLCLMTTCVIGATLAKYTTAGSGVDQARVAKWGVRISAVANSAFDTQYAKEDVGYTGTVSVQSSSKVVAPGTEGSAVQFTISGTPEVAVRLSFAMTVDNEVKLAAGTYTYTDGATVTLDSDYYPIKWTLNNGTTDLKTGTLAEIANYLSTHPVDYAPGTNLNTAVPTYTLSWAWDFDASVVGTNDKADTLLGDLAVNDSTITTTADYSTEVSYKLTITATQID